VRGVRVDEQPHARCTSICKLRISTHTSLVSGSAMQRAPNRLKQEPFTAADRRRDRSGAPLAL